MIPRRNGVGLYTRKLELVGFVFVFTQPVVFVVKRLVRRSACRRERRWYKHEGKQDDGESDRLAVFNFQFAILNSQFSILRLRLLILLSALTRAPALCRNPE